MKQKRHTARRGVVAAMAVALLLSACVPGGDDTADTGADTTTTSAAPGSTPTTTVDVELSAPLPLDPALRTGVLDNGLTYFIFFNDSPGDRAELRLAVDAGSLHEDTDQAGGAHFLEHMMFNGTTSYPQNELTAVLESFGPQFGADINAYTSFDETVYQLSLESEDDLLDLGVDVLREWATEASLTDTDVVEERGVVLEEWRLRDEGLAGRLNETVLGLLLPGTTYEGHEPIGTEASIRATTPEVLGRFYDDWYRPDTMAVIAVGDFDIDEMEQRIVDSFASMGETEDPRTSPVGTAPDAASPRAATLADAEVAISTVDVIWPVPAVAAETVGDRQEVFVLVAAMNMLATRLDDDARRGDAPLLGASSSTSGFTRGFSLASLSVEATPAETNAALDAVVTELERVRQYGFSDQEFERAITEIRAGVDLALDSSETEQDVSFAGDLVEHFLSSQAFMSAEQQHGVDTAILDRLTASMVTNSFAALLDEATPYIIVLGPDDGAGIPAVEDIEQLFAEPPAGPILPREDVVVPESLMQAPQPVPSTDSVVDEDLGFITLSFPNGATVMAWPTDIAENLVTVQIESFGGTSKVEVEDVTEASLASTIVNKSGVGDVDAPALDEFLADRVVEASPWISETREGIQASASSDDLEPMFQLIHLLMTEPRFDEVAVTSVIAEMQAVDATRQDVPSLVTGDALDDMYYSGNPRYVSPPTGEQLATFDADRSEQIYRERFADAGDFVYAIVGDFDPEELGRLIATYIGTLPGPGDRETWTDNQPLPPREVQLRTVQAGTDPQGAVSQYWTNELQPSHKDRLTGRVMELIVNARLRDRIREELSATYSPRAWVSLQRDPDPFIETGVEVTGDPERLEEISDEVLADLADLASAGPTDAELSTAVQQTSTEMELISNPELAEALVNSYLYPDEPVSRLIERYTLIEEVTADDVRSMARLAYDSRQRIEIRLVPLG
ncbi:MAG: M16 family metallopeptidase [Acidimicrobiia bacterium]